MKRAKCGRKLKAYVAGDCECGFRGQLSNRPFARAEGSYVKRRVNRILTLTAPALLIAGVAHAAGAGAGASPMTGLFATVEGCLTGDIAEFVASAR